jgi:hypothetical protein
MLTLCVSQCAYSGQCWPCPSDDFLRDVIFNRSLICLIKSMIRALFDNSKPLVYNLGVSLNDASYSIHLRIRRYAKGFLTMKNSLLIIFLLILFYCSCKSESQKVLDRLKRMNESPKDLVTDTTFRSIYGRISEKRIKNPHLYFLVDSLNTKLQMVNIFLDSLISAIKQIGTTGERTDVVSTKLIGTETETASTEKTHSIYKYAKEMSASEASKDKIESFFAKYRGLFGTTGFLQF